jgi:hypothetical protein
VQWKTEPGGQERSDPGFASATAVADLTRALIAKDHERLTFAGVLTPADDRAAERRSGFNDVVEESFPDQTLRIVNPPGEPVAMRTGRTLLQRVVQDQTSPT